MATVIIKYRNKEFEVNAGMTVRDAIKKVGLEPEAVLAVSDGKLITDDTILREGMQIKLVAVVSGGAWPLSPALSQREREWFCHLKILPSPPGRGAGGEGEPAGEGQP